MQTKALGVAISLDRTHTSIAAAGVLDGVQVFTLIEYLPGSDTADRIAAIATEREESAGHGESLWRTPTPVIIDPRSPAATLIAPLEARNLTITEMSARDLAVAHGQFLDELRAGRLKLLEAHPALDAAVQHAGVRPLAGADALERRRVDADASPLEAVELAVWRLLNAPPDRSFAY